MQSSTPTSVGSTRFCWVCGRAISLDNCKLDEHGNAVHSECYDMRQKLKQAGSLNEIRKQGHRLRFAGWAVHRAASADKLEIETQADEKNFYVWLRKSPRSNGAGESLT